MRKLWTKPCFFFARLPKKGESALNRQLNGKSREGVFINGIARKKRKIGPQGGLYVSCQWSFLYSQKHFVNIEKNSDTTDLPIKKNVELSKQVWDCVPRVLRQEYTLAIVSLRRQFKECREEI